MKLSQFKFALPKAQVAIYPHSLEREIKKEDGTVEKYRITRQDEARMMVVHRKSGTIDMFHKGAKGKPKKGDFILFKDIIDYFGENDCFILNDTKVFPARLFGTKEKTDATIEVFLLRELNNESHLWDVYVEPARKIRIGNKLFFDDAATMVAEVIDNTTSRGRTLRFLHDSTQEEFRHDLFALGEAPIPHYILEARGAQHASETDLTDFQTIYATHEGAVTAPATGLHFSRELMKRMEIKGIRNAFITLHCGLGNFQNIEVEDLTKHKIDSEQMEITQEACDIVNLTKKEGGKLLAVGASVLKATESSVGTDGLLKTYNGWTNRFIFPPYEFSLADNMVVNFYHPYSMMLMASCAFGGYELIMEAYNLAAKNGYMFGCFGDSLLILND